MSAQAHLSQFGISLSAANAWVFQNIATPATVFNISKQFGITSDMLAEIVSLSIPGVTGTQVEGFFSANGLDGASLGASGPDNNDGSFQLGSSQTFSLSPSGEASYSFNLEAGVFYSIVTNKVSGASGESYGYLLSGPEGVTADDAGKIMQGMIEAPKTGVYQLDITGSNQNLDVIEYKVEFDQFGQVPIADAQSLVTDDVGDFAVIATQLNSPGLYEYNASSGDVDWFTVSLQADTAYQFSVDKGSVTLIDKEGDGIQNVASGFDITYTSTETGIYHLKVNGISEVGDYILEFDQFGLQPRANDSGVQVDDHADLIAFSTLVDVNSSTSGAIGSLGDQDWFTVMLEAGATYQMGVNELTTDRSFSTYLNLYDSSGEQITSKYNGYNIEYTATESDLYHLRINDGRDDATGTYELDVTLL